MAKKRRVWIAMALPLVFMLPNSSCLLFPGNENKSPGDSNTNSTTPIRTGAQSAIKNSSLTPTVLRRASEISYKSSLFFQVRKVKLLDCFWAGLGGRWDYGQED
ncbi:hypothetical protein ERO13_A05G337466v2 [Gossypium hirsutum]|uniref:Uncharacterized protein n=1 Tax=Gossypium barbadense TaxID=3634 RepID=A0A5J5VYN1_GOSBA|nr:hypothetical protein ES319_A05G355500v1 [Gossypium barbadense]KAG4202427.1 hypothetical protein ERO13_A05G337466v2 [Gossypium hirsutum]